MSNALAVVPAQPVERLEFTPVQQQMIRDTFANGASEKEFEVLLEIAKTRNLNPLLRQVHFVQRWNSQLKRMVWAPQVSIDGMRAIAERTGKYAGSDEPEFSYDESGKLVCCKVRVYRKDWQRPAVGVAHFAEYAQKTKDGELTSFWRDKPHIMLAKCAESIALRKAFPEDTGGLYTDEETMQADKPARVEYDQETGEVTPLERQLEESVHGGAPQDVIQADTQLFDGHLAALLDARDRNQLTKAMARVSHDKARFSAEQLVKLREAAAEMTRLVSS